MSGATPKKEQHMSGSTASTIEKRQLNGRLEDVVVVRKFGEVILVPFSTALLADYGEGRVIAMCEDLASRGVVA